MLQARLRADDGWCEATIANISPTGVMIRCPSPPERTNVVEIRHRGICIVGRVMWSRGSRCGIRVQDPIDIDSLLAKSSISTTKRTSAEWRALSTSRARPSPAAKSAASKKTARFVDWIVIAAAGAAAAAIVASAADGRFSAPLSRADHALAQRRI